MTMSYAHGPSDVPAARRDDRREPAPHRRALRRARGARRRATSTTGPPTASCGSRSTRAARALLARGVGKGDRVGIWAPNRYEWVVTQFATARVGAILVTVNPAYKAAELAHALGKAGVSLLFMARGFRGADYVAMLAESGAPGCDTIVLEDDWESFLAEGDARLATPSWPPARRRCSFDDPINIQYTSGTTGAPKGATLTHHNILNNAYFSGRALALHRARPGVRPGAVLPLLRHGPRHARLREPRRVHGRPGESFDAARGARGGRRRALHLALRRADDVHRRARAPALRAVRPHQPADRDHGRRAVPGRADEAGPVADAHAAR